MPKSKLIIKILKSIIRFLPLLLFVVFVVPIVGMASIEIGKILGLRAVPVPVVGTGSMYPSLFWSSTEGGPEDESKKVVEEYRTTPHLYHRFEGIVVAGYTFFRRDVGYGDMVAFKNDKTIEILKTGDKDTSAGFIKRVIGVPGDTLELRDGFVYKNGNLFSEPYISSPRSTYGGTGLKDCIEITVPQGSYFVLGDNRKVSDDSRFELGLIKDQDILFILPYSEQKIYQSLWRDTTGDEKLLGQPTLSVDDFVNLVNEARVSKGARKLTLKSNLVKSSALRGERVLANPKTDYDMKAAIVDSGYSNIILGEFVSYGHYSATELLANLLYGQATAKQITSKDFSDIGITDVSHEINGCPTQVIVGHLGGYIPASYQVATIDSWRELRDNLNKVLPSWERARDYNNIDQVKLSSLISILRRRLSLAEEILNTMEKREWLSDDQQARIKKDGIDAQAAELLSKELNKE